MKQSTSGERLRRGSPKPRRVAVWMWAASLVCSMSSRLAAQELWVIENSEQDHAAADKLAELIKQPFVRFELSLTPNVDVDCRGEAQLELWLDSAHDSVRLMRCRDRTVLARALEPGAARETPYLAAFVAAELLALNAELAAAQEQATARPAPSAAPTPAPVRARSRWRLSLGGELFAIGEPFRGTLRPNFGIGLLVEPEPHRPGALVELQLSALGNAELSRGSERLGLTRNDGRLRAGIRYALGGLALAGLVFARASLTEAEYRGAAQNSNTAVRWGLGAACEIEVAIAPWLSLVADIALDFATSRSDYRVGGISWARDPARTLNLGLALVAHAPL